MHAESVLEFESLRAVIGRYVRSALGRTEVESLAPTSDRALIEGALADAAEGIDYVRAMSHPQAASKGAAIRIRFGDINDPAEAVARLRIEGSTLEAVEILEVARMLDLASEARSILLGARERFPRLARHATGIADLREIAADLNGKILPDGSVADHASVALARLRREGEKQRHKIQESLERFLQAHREDGTLQEDFVTIRDDRFVVPVVTGRERRVDGVIHGASGSGHTLFVEPIETIQLNNELVRLREEELREVHRVLREFTARLRTHAVEIRSTATALGALELIFAKAEFAVDFNCCVPRLSPAGSEVAVTAASEARQHGALMRSRNLILREARHPLLEDLFKHHPSGWGTTGTGTTGPGKTRTVVPVSLSLDESERTLLISGPNTGGKTVALKTVGMLALMTHAGLPVPAAEAEFPLFDDILADIGDHQSIQESLSSFSAHIMSMKSMLEHATPDSLILVDELGRATDPEEGGALGVALLEEFQKVGAFTLASTHLLPMKVYGASTKGVRNGSMGFDDETLQPTYVLRLGAPGKSAGLDIASRLGLDPSLIESARSRMTNTERDVSRFLNELHARIDAVEQQGKELAGRELALDAREKSLEKTWEKKYSEKLQEIDKKAATLVQEFEQRAEETLGELSQKARVKVAKTKREFQESMEAVAPASTAKNAAPKARLEEGASVRLKGIRQPARIRRVLDNGMIEVEAGFMKMRVPESDVEEVLGGNIAVPKRPSVTFTQGSDLNNYREINIIGQRAEAAMEQVDKLLDGAALAQVERVRIIHGHGMGILKRAVADLLKDNPHVAKFYVAGPEEGGTAATIVELK
jgi:DNA mismatch repair protein MutS2